MGAFAAVRVPVDLTRRSAAAAVALDTVDTFPGVRNAAVAGAGGIETATVSFEMQFPGNLSALIARLNDRLIPTGAAADVTIPVTNLVPEIVASDPDRMHRELEAGEGNDVWDPEFVRGRYVLAARLSGDRVQASVIPCSNSMHELYDTLLHLGFVADGAATL